ncbi:DUF4129 domain-containing protein [Halorubellus salinus]|uniref:DUF4129 domain-containing protein n=1 Tax=Halorubellus salinus TaxID=755309 RepID=UPI001D070EDB|nr:DUF4129 domain-containing protein [Halorubellus salinus]
MRRTRTMLAAVVLVVAFGLAAGSLPAPGDAPAVGAPDERADGPPSSGASSDGGVERAVENPVSSATRDRLLVAVVGLALAAGYAFVPRQRRTVAVAAGVVVVAAGSYAWLGPATTGALSAVGDVASTATGGALGVVLAGVLALAAAMGVWRAFGRRGDDGASRAADATDRGTDDDGEGDEGARSVAVHPAARQASDEVGRAWQRVVASVSLPAPAARTPREFVRAADAEGVDASAFERLTAVFERVRYGDADPAREAERARSLAARAVDDAAAPGDAQTPVDVEADGDEMERNGRERGGGDA